MPQPIKLFTRDKEILLIIKNLLSEDLENHPSIHLLSIQHGINRDKLKKGFKLLYGQPIEAFHRSLRMEEAKRLLLQTEKPVYEIAWLVGYEHQQNFVAAFKQVMGMRPGEWRRQAVK